MKITASVGDLGKPDGDFVILPQQFRGGRVNCFLDGESINKSLRWFCSRTGAGFLYDDGRRVLKVARGGRSVMEIQGRYVASGISVVPVPEVATEWAAFLASCDEMERGGFLPTGEMLGQES